jgi:hypothetical protein
MSTFADKSRRVPRTLFAIGTLLFSVATFVQHRQGEDYGSMPAFAWPGAIMVAVIASTFVAVVMHYANPRHLTVFSSVFVIAAAASLVLILVYSVGRDADNEREQSLPPVSGTRGTPAAYAPAAPGIPER